MRRAILIVAVAVLLATINWTIHARERLLETGRVVLLELAPVDPRALMQGDYMALRFKAASEAFGPARGGTVVDGAVVLLVDERGVGSYRRLDAGAPLAADEARLRYRIRNGQPKFATNAFFFEEGHAVDYAKARYGEFRVAPNGEAILMRLRDAALVPLGAAPAR